MLLREILELSLFTFIVKAFCVYNFIPDPQESSNTPKFAMKSKGKMNIFCIKEAWIFNRDVYSREGFLVINLKHEVCSDEIGEAVLLRAIFRRHFLANIVGLEIWREAGSSKSSKRQVFFQFCSERFTDSLLVYNSLLPVNCKGKSNFDINSKIYPVWLQKSKNVQVERKTDTLKDGYILIL